MATVRHADYPLGGLRDVPAKYRIRKGNSGEEDVWRNASRQTGKIN
ncbi:hypothetical protein ACFFL1_01785 [Samsonia erythrinae]|nr:hypothetical protein [Samsonia erythrinae]